MSDSGQSTPLPFARIPLHLPGVRAYRKLVTASPQQRITFLYRIAVRKTQGTPRELSL